MSRFWRLPKGIMLASLHMISSGRINLFSMYSYRLIVLETPAVKDYTDLRNEVNRLVNEELERDPNLHMFNTEIHKNGDIYVIYLHTQELNRPSV